MIKISPTLMLNESEIQFTAIRSPGPGGQNVNKVATGIQLRFNILHALSIPEEVRIRLLTVLVNKITRKGDLMIKATRFRTQEDNKQDALQRLQKLLASAARVPKKRKKTKPTNASKERRLQEKKLHAKTKLGRRSKDFFS